MEADPKKQFADRVVCFSSQYGGENSQSYAALNLAGNSYNFPSYGDFTQAFVLRSYGPWWNLAPSGRKSISKNCRNKFISEDFVDLEFKESVIPTKIEILETYNPGAVVRILALLPCNSYSSQAPRKQRWSTLWSGEPQQCRPQARKFSPKLKEIKHPTNFIRLEFSQQHLKYYTELDAVFLYGKPAIATSFGKRKPAGFGDSDLSLTARLFRELSLNEEKEGLPRNGSFDILPSELILYIFSFLELIDLTRAARTCRLFFLHCYDPVWYKELDLKPYWNLITNDALDSLHTRCTSTEKLDLSWCGSYDAVTAPTICRFVQHCGRRLVCLRLSCCQFVDDQVVQAVCQHCPNLEELDLQSCNSKLLDKDGLIRLQSLKKLKRVNLYRVSKLTDDTLKELIKSWKGLQHLNLGGCASLVESDLLMQSLSNHCSGLVSLDLWRNKSLSESGITCLADGCALLEELDIGWCTNVTSAECVAYLASKCKKLKKLFVTAIRCINDDVVEALADNCPDIEQVDVLGTGLIRANSITRLLRQCKKLIFLDVSFCSQLSTEFIRSFQGMYPHVSFKKSFVHNEDPL